MDNLDVSSLPPPKPNEIESIVGTELIKIKNELDHISILLAQSRFAGDNAWKTLMDNYHVFTEIKARLNTVARALEWDVNEKPAWEKKYDRKFNKALECGDG